jgi:hypothetical protein
MRKVYSLLAYSPFIYKPKSIAMKQLLLLVMLVLSTLATTAQTQVDYASLKTEKKEDFTDELNKAALQAATELLSLPLEKENPQRQAAFTFLMRWMTGTPHYSFEVDETATKISSANEDLLVVYLAAMTKYALENGGGAKDKKALKLNTVRQVLAYCKAQSVKLSGELKKMDKAEEKGELETYLKL